MISIGNLAKRANCTVPTIRYYEKIGLLPKAARREGGHRAYGRADLARLNLIRRCRDCDISLDSIRALIAHSEGGRSCVETFDFFDLHRKFVRARITSLQELDMSLSLYLQSCTEGCMATNAPCGIYDELQAP